MKYDYKKIEEYSSMRMGVAEICDLMGYDQKTFSSDRHSDSKLDKAVRRGRAQAVLDASKIVTDTMNGKNLPLDPKVADLKLKAALEFLKSHGREWQKQ